MRSRHSESDYCNSPGVTRSQWSVLKGRIKASRVGTERQIQEEDEAGVPTAFLPPQPSEGSPARLPPTAVELARKPAFTKDPQMILFAQFSFIL